MTQYSANITKVVAQLTKSLSARNKDIISRRFGLKTGKKETLESIGKSYGITRERVRQIEDFSINQLAKIVNEVSDVQKYVSFAKSVIDQNGGVMKESDLFDKYSGSSKDNIANASLVFVLTLAGEPVRYYETDAFNTFWAIDRGTMDTFTKAVSTLVSALSKSGKAVSGEEFTKYAQAIGVSEFDVDAVLSVSKVISRNVFDQVGLTSWADIKPRGVRDKAYLVLKMENSPKHFTDITKLINVNSFSERKANTQTVHNELIKDERFVLVGRGIYGLAEWGYRPGTVKDVLMDVLRTSSKPLNKEDLIAKVAEMRMVKENTILLNLQDSKTFIRKDDGTYILKKA